MATIIVASALRKRSPRVAVVRSLFRTLTRIGGCHFSAGIRYPWRRRKFGAQSYRTCGGPICEMQAATCPKLKNIKQRIFGMYKERRQALRGMLQQSNRH